MKTFKSERAAKMAYTKAEKVWEAKRDEGSRALFQKNAIATTRWIGSPMHVAIWEGINAYARACGGDVENLNGARMNAVVRVERALEEAFAARPGLAQAASGSCAVRRLRTQAAEIAARLPGGGSLVNLVHELLREVADLPAPRAGEGEETDGR